MLYLQQYNKKKKKKKRIPRKYQSVEFNKTYKIKRQIDFNNKRNIRITNT